MILLFSIIEQDCKLFAGNVTEFLSSCELYEYDKTGFSVEFLLVLETQQVTQFFRLYVERMFEGVAVFEKEEKMSSSSLSPEETMFSTFVSSFSIVSVKKTLEMKENIF